MRRPAARPPRHSANAIADIVQLILLPLPWEARRCIVQLLGKPKYIKADAGNSHFVLIRDDGVAVAGGDGSDGESEVPTLPVGVYYVNAFAGCGFTVLIRSDGQAIFKGKWPCDGDFGNPFPGPAPQGTKYIGGAAGEYHGVLLRDDGEAVGFGMNYKDNGGPGCSDIPTLPAGLRYVGAAAEYCHTILLRNDGHAICCGQPQYHLDIPDLPDGVRYIGTAVGSGFTALLRDDGCAICLGRNSPFDNVRVPLANVHYVGMSAGWDHIVLLRSDGLVDSFGAYVEHRADDDTDYSDKESIVEEIIIPPLSANVKYVAVASGAHCTVLLRSDGEAVLCGMDDFRIPVLPAGLRYIGPAIGIQGRTCSDHTTLRRRLQGKTNPIGTGYQT